MSAGRGSGETAAPATALVVARRRRHIEIETAGGERLSCIAGGRRLDALCGDLVRWRREPDGTCVVTGSLPRSTLLTRIDSRGRPEPVAANLTQLVAVVAPVPEPDWVLLDRYLVAAELMGIAAVIVYNKCDLAPPAERLADYDRIGYRIAVTSVAEGSGLAELEALLAGASSALLGQSGVGKSSLLNRLAGESVQAVGALGSKGTHGRHTTTTAELHRLRAGGTLVDTPGVRQYAPYVDDQADLAAGFREFRPFLGSCRFDDCRHCAEPDCAVKAAVEAGQIARARYASYRELLERRARRAAR